MMMKMAMMIHNDDDINDGDDDVGDNDDNIDHIEKIDASLLDVVLSIPALSHFAHRGSHLQQICLTS